MESIGLEKRAFIPLLASLAEGIGARVIGGSVARGVAESGLSSLARKGLSTATKKGLSGIGNFAKSSAMPTSWKSAIGWTVIPDAATNLMSLGSNNPSEALKMYKKPIFSGINHANATKIV